MKEQQEEELETHASLRAQMTPSLGARQAPLSEVAGVRGYWISLARRGAGGGARRDGRCHAAVPPRADALGEAAGGRGATRRVGTTCPALDGTLMPGSSTAASEHHARQEGVRDGARGFLGGQRAHPSSVRG